MRGAIRNRLETPKFAHAVRRRQGQILREVQGKFVSDCEAAQAALASMATGKAKADAAQITAARAVLELGLKFTSFSETNDRITNLEGAVQELKKGRKTTT